MIEEVGVEAHSVVRSEWKCILSGSGSASVFGVEVDSVWKCILSRTLSSYKCHELCHRSGFGVEVDSECKCILSGSEGASVFGGEVDSEWQWSQTVEVLRQCVDTQKIELQNPLDHKPNPKSKSLSYKCHELSHHINVTNSVIV